MAKTSYVGDLGVLFKGFDEIGTMEQHAVENANSCLCINISSYLEIFSGQSSDLYINVVHFFQHQC